MTEKHITNEGHALRFAAALKARLETPGDPLYDEILEIAWACDALGANALTLTARDPEDPAAHIATVIVTTEPEVAERLKAAIDAEQGGET